MNKKVILFDLDGTLLPMDARLFEKTYFGLLGKYLANYGYEPKQLLEVVGQGVKAMVTNDGTKTNEQAFWDTFVSVYGESSLKDRPYFEAFYRDHFDEIKVSAGFNPETPVVINELKKMGYRIVLATNPLFPDIAIFKRIKWAGLDPNDFELVTTYETSHFSKPNTNYYKEIIEKLGVTPNECIMVGNDMEEDMIAKNIGLDIFLITYNLINRTNKDVSEYPNGSLKDFLKYLKNLG